MNCTQGVLYRIEPQNGDVPNATNAYIWYGLLVTIFHRVNGGFFKTTEGFFVKALIAAAAALSLVGCASVMNETTHGVRVDTKQKGGTVVVGAECVATNDYGSTTFKSGTVQALRRSSKDMTIVCTQPGELPANGTMISRPNVALAGNIILGGVIGAVVDHNRGTAYTYPTWIDMVFGETLVFDRQLQKGDTALAGVAANSPAAMANAPVKSNSTSTACAHQMPGANC
jgi:hypothetical protein